MENPEKIYKIIGKGLACGTLGTVLFSCFVKSALEHVDFPIAQMLNLYRDDSFFETEADPNMIVDKLIDAIESNRNITEEEIQILKQLKNCMLEHPVFDFKDRYQRFYTLKVKESDKIICYNSKNPIEAGYSYPRNICTIYTAAGGNTNDFIHESGHILLGGCLSDYFYLTEGITELVIAEYYRNGIPEGYWTNVYCARILCELIDPNVLLKACDGDNSSLIVESLTNVLKDETATLEFLNTMESYCQKEFETFLTEEDKTQFQNTIKSIVSKAKTISVNQLEQIYQYLDAIEYPHIDKRKEILFYFNQNKIEEINKVNVKKGIGSF